VTDEPEEDALAGLIREINEVGQFTERNVRIVILTGDKSRYAVLVPDFAIDAIELNEHKPGEPDVHLLKDGDDTTLMGISVGGGTLRYDADTRTIFVRLHDET
jgi:hypothetical protein